MWSTWLCHPLSSANLRARCPTPRARCPRVIAPAGRRIRAVSPLVGARRHARSHASSSCSASLRPQPFKTKPSPHAMELQKRILAVKSVEELWSIEQHGFNEVAGEPRKFDEVNSSTFLHRLAKLDRGSAQTDARLDKFLRALHVRGGMIEWRPREFANSLWALGKMRATSHLWFVHSLPFGAFHSSSDFRPQELANTAWALARLTTAPPSRFVALLDDDARARLVEYKPQEISNLAWALAYFKHAPRFLFTNRHAITSSWQGQNLSNVAWAIATTSSFHDSTVSATHHAALSSSVPNVLADIAAIAEPKLRMRSENVEQHERPWTAQEVSNLLWAFAHCALRPRPLFAAAAERIMQGLWPSIQTHDLANIAWSFGKIRYYHKELFDRIVDHTSTRLQQHRPRVSHDSKSREVIDMCNLMWACAALNHGTADLVHNWARCTMGQWHGQPSEAIASTMWSLARVQVEDTDLLRTLACHLIDSDKVSAQAVSNLVWTLQVSGVHDEAIEERAKQMFRAVQHTASGMDWVGFITGITLSSKGDYDFEKQFRKKILSPYIDALVDVSKAAPGCETSFEKLRATVERLQLSHIGEKYSREALTALGIEYSVALAHKVPHRGPPPVTAFIDCYLQGAGLDQVFTSSSPEDTTVNLKPLFSIIARDDHAERLALSALCARLMSSEHHGPCSTHPQCTTENANVQMLTNDAAEPDDEGHMAAVVRVFVGHWCCVSCLGILAQVRQRFPLIQLHVGWHNVWERSTLK